MTMKSTVLWFVVLTVAGCGGGGSGGDDSSGNSSGLCDVIAGGSSMVNADPAATAEFDNAERAFDADQSSAATLRTTGSGTSSITGTVQSGVVVSGELVSGVLLPRRSGVSNAQVTITTLLDGVTQESGAAVTTQANDQFEHFGLMTSMTYNALQVTFAVTPGTVPDTFDILELCTTPRF